MKPIFRGVVKQGKLKVDNPTQFMIYLAILEGNRFQLEIHREKHARTLSQNAYYWGVIIELLGQHFGYEPDEMHEALKFKFLRKHEDSDLVTVGSTAKLDTVQFSEYIEKIMEWASKEYGIYIPVPGEYFE